MIHDRFDYGQYSSTNGLMRPPKSWTCEACGGLSKFVQFRCFMCGSYRDAIYKLLNVGISPAEIHEILTGQKEYHGITMHVANIVIEVLKTHDDQPH